MTLRWYTRAEFEAEYPLSSSSAMAVLNADPNALSITDPRRSHIQKMRNRLLSNIAEGCAPTSSTIRQDRVR